MQETIIQRTCQIFGNQGIIIQIVLAALSFSVLVIKRYRQKQKRPWKIWAFDTSKQGVSQLVAHFLNVAVSLKLSSQLSHDACMWYFTINILDNTFGVFVCLLLLKMFENNLLPSRLLKYKSGNYYQITQQINQIQTTNSNTNNFELSIKKQIFIINYKIWIIQLLIWNIIVIISKGILLGFQIIFNQPLNQISQFMLGWIKPYPIYQLIFIIIIVPVIMNGLAFWIQDNSLKRKINKQKNILIKDTKLTLL